MMRRLLSALILTSALISPALAQDDLKEARAILARTGIIDGHNDVPWQVRETRGGRLESFSFERLSGPDRARFHTDLERLKAGGFSGVFWSVYVPATLGPQEALRATLTQIDIARRLIAAHPERMAFATTAEGARAAMKAGRVASLMGAEGGHSIANSMAALRELHAAGVRYMTLTHSLNTDWADSATDEPRHGGLTSFGQEVVREMNRLGMLVDLSHVSPETMMDALDATAAPVIFSHSNAKAVTPHQRNVPDAVLTRLKANGGVIMVTFVPPFLSEADRQWSAARAAEEARLKALNPHARAEVDAGLKGWEARTPRPEVSSREVADHIDHIRRVAGIAHIGIGSDFDGVPVLPRDLSGADETVNLFAELIRRGYSRRDLEAIAQGNILRVMAEAERVAARLQRERGPSEATLAAAAATAALP